MNQQLQLPQFPNPYRPGAGHPPPHMAGRQRELDEFARLLKQDIILENLVLTGLRGVGKTVLLERFKPEAMRSGWLWAGTDLSETASVSEENLALRLMADLSVITSTITVDAPPKAEVGFVSLPDMDTRVPLSYEVLVSIYTTTPGLVADKIKAVLEFAGYHLRQQGRERVIFAYDEAQKLSDNADRDEYPLSVLLDVFQSIQRKGIPFMLVLTGLTTLFPKLVEARTYAERMFHIVMLGKLTEEETREAILTPLEAQACPVRFSPESVGLIVDESAGYPYFIQFICREVFDVWITQIAAAEKDTNVPVEAIQRKLDSDFFAGRWSKVTDRQRQMLWVIANLERSDEEFSILELVSRSKAVLPKGFSPSHASQMLVSLAEQGLIYKNRHGKYSFAVPLLGRFILRTYDPPNELALPV